jgi:hypothetical protein
MKRICYLRCCWVGTGLIVGTLCFTPTPPLKAQPAEPGAQRLTTRIATNRVTMTVTGGERTIQANGWPDHTPGEFPRSGNPNTLVEHAYQFRIPVNPQVAEKPTAVRHALFGVAVNGVPFDPGTAEFWNNDPRSGWVFEAKSGFINLGIDEHNAHVQPNGAYHYHGLPNGLVAKLGGDGRKMLLLGYASDGFPIYSSFGLANPKDPNSPVKKLHASYRLKAGTRQGPGGKHDGRFVEDYEYVKGAGDLDECNGRFGVTPEYPKGIYHYHITGEFPYIPRLVKGTPDPSFTKRGGPPPHRGFRQKGPRAYTGTSGQTFVANPIGIVSGDNSNSHRPSPTRREVKP